MKRIRCLLLLAVLAAGSAVGCSHRRVYVARVPPPPPPPRYEARAYGRPPGPGYAWVDGHWRWRGNHWHWVRGHWVRVR